ncbi:nucleotide-diphospho-sugar transferase [Tothia fuscella]|uniref:Nucleotide-diphospho-sugar transferase n=1 Tax=Tothia fuscella TaxID=1048955 RepID=A0A9P4U2Q6_9PEZI|nr:nucleotide-diphospho-sugar transferase [Tothia fuscella]
MVTKHYNWADDEEQDRLYYSSKQKENANGRFHWPAILRRSKAAPLLAAIIGIWLLTWWWMTSSSDHYVVPQLNWSRFAYSQYTTDTQSLCNALLVFESLVRLGSKADRVLLYPEEWTQKKDDRTAWLLQTAQQKYGVKLEPVQLLSAEITSESSKKWQKDKPGTLSDPTADWSLSITKLRVFDLVQYDRVLHLDSDITLLHHMDELFHLPKTPIAMPRAYWSDGPPSTWPLTSLIMLVEPNPNEVIAMMQTLHRWQKNPNYSMSKKYDMDLLNHRFAASALVLPHRPYTMLTAGFRSHNHSTYLGYHNGFDSDPRAKWDPDLAFKEAKLVHFSDWPLPKPWVMWNHESLSEIQPDCGGVNKGTCREREIWKGLYDDFRRRRKDVCKILSVPAPDWKEWKKSVGAGGKK